MQSKQENKKILAYTEYDFGKTKSKVCVAYVQLLSTSDVGIFH